MPRLPLQGAPWLGVVLGLMIVDLPAARAAVFRVGAGGTHGTIQEAVDAAAASDGDDEIRIRAGAHSGPVFALLLRAGSNGLDISGGWNASFSSAGSDPGATVVTGDDSDSTLSVNAYGQAFSIRNLTLRRGNAGLNLSATDGSVSVSRCVFRDNRTGVTLRMYSASLAFTDNVATLNRRGRGVLLTGDGVATLVARNNQITSNSLAMPAGNSVAGGGAYVSLRDEATAVFEDNKVVGNALEVGGVAWFGSGLNLSASGASRLVARRNLVSANKDLNAGTPTTAQLEIFAAGGASVLASEFVVAAGSTTRESGVRVVVFEAGQAFLANFTVVDSGKLGVRATESDSGRIVISNTIVSGHSPNLSLPAGVERFSMLGGTGDPRFVNRATGNYRLRSTSSAVNRGRPVPPGGLGPLDFDRTARVKGGRVDIGAFESF